MRDRFGGGGGGLKDMSRHKIIICFISCCKDIFPTGIPFLSHSPPGKFLFVSSLSVLECYYH